MAGLQERIYRVDKFVVPDRAREEFIGKVSKTHEVLRTVPGFLQDFVLELESGPGEFKLRHNRRVGSRSVHGKGKASCQGSAQRDGL